MANEDKFNGKAGFYNSRPLYPQECIDYLAQKFNLRADSVIADIGAGTGILTKPFLTVRGTVYAVEPNADMFFELCKNLSPYQNAICLKASAEATGIPPLSCDAAVVGTAFHWFDKDEFRIECKRILRNKKHVAILRIANNNESDKRIDEVKHYSMQDLNDAKAFFGTGFTEHIRFEYTQSFDEARYINDLLSSATAPLPNEANFDEYVSRCKNVFYKYFGNGHAELPFAVNCYIGRLDT